MKTCICCIIKDEQPYLKEWLDYNLNVGFDTIYLYEDFNSKSHKDIVSQYDENKVILTLVETIDECKGNFAARQYNTYMYHLNKYKTEYDWIAFFDIDEFIKFDNDYSLHKLLNEFKDYEGVSLYWRNYGANGLLSRDMNKGVEETFCNDNNIKEIPFSTLLYDYKTIVNTKLCYRLQSVHKSRLSYNTNYKKMDIRYKLCEKTYDKAWINHYFTKSWEEFLNLRRRGDLSRNFRKIELFFEVNKEFLPQKEELMKDLNYNEFISLDVKELKN